MIYDLSRLKMAGHRLVDDDMFAMLRYFVIIFFIVV